MSVGIYALAHAASGEEINQWVKRYDPEAFDGRGDVEFTADPAEALRFESTGDALECWKRVPSSRPLRPDGRSNRPLTAFTVTVGPLPETALRA